VIHSRDLACQFGPAAHAAVCRRRPAAGRHAAAARPVGQRQVTWLALVAGLLSAVGGRIAWPARVGDLSPGPARDAWRADHRLPAAAPAPQRGLNVRTTWRLVAFAAGQGRWTGRHRAHPGRPGRAAWLGAARRSSRAARRSGWPWRGRCCAAPVLLADEPTASLDDAACPGAGPVAGRGAAHGGTLVVATHDARAPWRLPDRRPDCLGSRIRVNTVPAAWPGATCGPAADGQRSTCCC
jgi:putative ABC transport system ATP-binding protein